MKILKICAFVFMCVAGSFMVSCGGPESSGGAAASEEGPLEKLGSREFSFSVDEYHRAAREGDLEAVKLFNQAGMALESASRTGETALIVAAENGQEEVVSYLIDKGANFEIQSGGKSPLFLAAELGHSGVVKVLLDAGADPTIPDSRTWVPLTIAAFKGHADAVRVLSGVSAEELDVALHLAAVNGDCETIDVLLNAGASVFARSKENRTALMYAASNGNADAVKVLLQNGSNRFAIDDDGRTSAQQAQMKGHMMVADYLLEPPTVEERTLPETPSFAEFAPERDEFTAESSHKLPSVDRVNKIAGIGHTVVGSRYPAPQRIEGAVVKTGSVLPVVPETGRGEEPLGVPADNHTEETPEVSPSGISAIAGKLRMHSYGESQLPVMLDDVEGETATVRLLYGEGDAVSVKTGGEIGKTGLEVVRVRRRFISSKQGKGDMVNVSEMLIRNIRTGEKTLVVKDVPAKSMDTYALMSLEGGETLYDVRRDDQFSAQLPEIGRVEFRVADIRPTQVVLEEVRTGETFTILRSSPRS